MARPSALADLVFGGATERDRRAGAQSLKEELDRARADRERAKREGDLAKAGELSYGISPELEKKLGEADDAGLGGGEAGGDGVEDRDARVLKGVVLGATVRKA